MQLEDITSNTQYDIITIDKAMSIIHEAVNDDINIKCEKININQAFGRILCQPIYSKCNVPAFRVSTKHGYAVLASDNKDVKIVLYKTTSDPISLSPGTCMWVKSGDRVPDEATAVVKVKDVKRIVNHKTMNNSILIMIKPEFGQNIKNVGSDIPKDKLIMSPSTRIGPAELGLLAATGCNEIVVAKPIFVGVLSIGDSLKPTDPSKPKYYVYDSSKISLLALLEEIGSMLIPKFDFKNEPEDKTLIMNKINAALKIVDVLVIIGCVNDHDVLKTVLRDYLKASIHFGNVNTKPGKSTTFATCEVEGKTKYLLCLSGNPVSTLTSAQLFLIPLLNGLCQKFKHRKMIDARINQQFTLHPRPRVVWSNLRWNVNEKSFPEPLCKENLVNDNLFSSQGANALLMLPPQEVDHEVTYPICASALLLDSN